MTRKDYISIAKVIKNLAASSRMDFTSSNLAAALGDMMAIDNPRFNKALFMEACGER